MLSLRIASFSLVLCTFGCGGETAPSSDPAPAPPQGVVSAPIHVVVTDGPRANVPVFFHDSTGLVIARTVTDANGRASSPTTLAEPPSQVTVLIGHADFHRALTWAFVEPGDELLFENPLPAIPRGSYAVELPGPYPNATEYSLVPSLATTNDASVRLLSTSIPNGTRGAIVAQATNEANEVLALSFARDLLAPHGVYIPVTLGPWVAPAHVEVEALNVPTEQEPSSKLVEVVGPAIRTESADILIANKAKFAVPPSFADSYDVSAEISPIAPLPTDDLALRTLLEHISTPRSVAFDFTTALPKITSPIMELTAPRRPTLKWELDDPNNVIATTTDAGVITLRWGSGTPSTGPAPDDCEWLIFFPSDRRSIQVPALPPDADAWQPLALKSKGFAVTFIDLEAVTGFKAFRHDINALALQQPHWRLRENGKARWTMIRPPRF